MENGHLPHGQRIARPTDHRIQLALEAAQAHGKLETLPALQMLGHNIRTRRKHELIAAGTPADR